MESERLSRESKAFFTATSETPILKSSDFAKDLPSDFDEVFFEVIF
jgi:hypothetical protein